MRLPVSRFSARAHGAAVSGADECGAMDVALPGLRFDGALRHGVTQPIVMAPLPEPESYRLALAALAQRPEEAISLDFALPFCAAHCLCCDRDILAAQPRQDFV